MNEEKSSCQINESNLKSRVKISIAVPYGWQRRILANDLVVYLSPTNAILDSFESIRRYLELPNSCKCGLQCPLTVEKVFNFDPLIQSKSWEVTQVLEGTHCRQKSNILEMATLNNCIETFDEPEEKSVKRLKRTNTENSIDSINNFPTTPSKRPRGRPRKSTQTSPNAQIDFNDPSTTNFLLSAFASGATTDSNAIVQHLIEKAQQPTRISLKSDEERKAPIFYLNNQPFVLQSSTPTSRLDDAGHYLIVNGLVQPRTLNSLLKNLRNSSSFTGVDHLIATIEKFEQSQTKSTSTDSPMTKKTVRRRVTKKIKDECQITTNEVMITPVQTDVNSLDLSSNAWPNDPNLNSLLFHEDFHFDDFDSYLSVDQSSSSTSALATENNYIFASHLL